MVVEEPLPHGAGVLVAVGEPLLQGPGVQVVVQEPLPQGAGWLVLVALVQEGVVVPVPVKHEEQLRKSVEVRHLSRALLAGGSLRLHEEQHQEQQLVLVPKQEV